MVTIPAEWYKSDSGKTNTIALRPNGDDSKIETKQIFIRPYPISVTYPDGYESLHRHFSTPSSSLIDTYTWNYGDGSATETGRTQGHTYSTSGYYTVTLTLTLDDGSAITNQQGIFVGPGTRYIQGHTIYEDETWYAGGTYVVQGGITVAQGGTLTIEPGVVIKFANQVGITVNGTLDARGADDSKIVFTSVEDNTYGGDTDSFASDPNHPDVGDTWQVCPECFGDGGCAWAANYWGQIVFGPTSVNSVIDRAIILWGGSVRSGVWCYNPYGTGMVSIQSSLVTVTNSAVSHSWGSGIDVYNASPLITGDRISGNGGRGIYLSGNGSSPVITGGEISNNGQDGIYDDAGSSFPAITGELITGNGGWGIACSGSPNPSITGNTVSTNGVGGIFCSPSVFSGNTITGNIGPAIQQDVSGAWADGTNTISGNIYNGVAITGGTLSRDTTFTANNALYLIGNTVTVPAGVKLTIEPGVVIKFANQVGITVNGTLDARGADDSKIVFTSVEDNTYGGDTDSFASDPNHPDVGDTWQVCPECFGDGGCAWAANYWGQIVFGPTSVNSVIDRAIILLGGSVRSGVWCYNPYGTGMVSIQSSSVTVTSSAVSHSWGNGIDVYNASPVITGNTITGNYYGLWIQGSSGTYQGNTISGNLSFGLYYSGSSIINATNNNWGDQSGPLDDSDDRASGGLFNPAGLGNKVSDHVLYYPWTGTTVGLTATPKGLAGATGMSSIKLQWTANTEAFLGGYKVYYGTSPGAYGTPVILGAVTSHELSGLSSGTDYYITISSMNTVGVESAKASAILVRPGRAITVISPNGSETWQAGSPQTITWTYTGDAGSTVKIELVKGGSVVREITPNTPVGTSGSGTFPCTIPADLGGGDDYRVKVTSTSDATVTDMSDSNFAISAPTSITLTAPNGGETWYAGTTKTVSWTYSSSPGATARIMLLKGDTPVATIAASVPIGKDGKGSRTWTIPTKQAPGDNYKIGIVSTTNSSCADVSDGTYSIKALGPITVLAPNGGETWQVGSKYTIRWKSTVDIGATVKIELLKGDMVAKTIASSAASGSLGNGSFPWTVPKNLASYGSDYRVRVTSNENPSYTDTSDKTFTISGPTLDVTAPDGGESWARGTQQTITWTYTDNPGGNVKIQLLKAGALARTITTATPIGAGGQGSYLWTIPKDLGARSDYQIKITHVTIKGCTDTSAGNFSITKVALVASAGPDQKVEESAKVRLNGANSTGFVKETATFLWQQLDGPQTKLSNPAAVAPVFTAPEAGVDGASLMFQLTVTGEDGVQADDSCIVNVTPANIPPTAEAGPTQTVAGEEMVTLDGSGSSDPDDGITTYSWKQISGPPVTLSDPSAIQPTFTAPEVGVDGASLTFQLTVTDQGGLRTRDACLVNVTWMNHPPKAEAGPGMVVQPGALVVLDGSQSLDSDGKIVSYRWSQLAGQPVNLSDPTAAQTSFTAPLSGSEVEELVFQLRVTDSKGLQDKQKVVVTIIGASRTAPE